MPDTVGAADFQSFDLIHPVDAVGTVSQPYIDLIGRNTSPRPHPAGGFSGRRLPFVQFDGFGGITGHALESIIPVQGDIGQAVADGLLAARMDIVRLERGDQVVGTDYS